MNGSDALADAHHFTHDAMNTTFSVRLRGLERHIAQDMARECFELVDSLESHLSRFADGSDVARINRLGAGETLYLSEPCHECLLLALDAYGRTGGLFDITLGTRIEHHKSGASGPLPPLAGTLTIHPDIPAVTCEVPGRELDLGGIGKGFALDQLKLLLRGRDAPDALLAAGASSLLAFGPSSWPADLSGECEKQRILLTNQALSASGTDIQGNHILHPDGPQAMPELPSQRLWVVAETAVLAEIWSTALMLVTPQEIPHGLTDCPEISAVWLERNRRLVHLFDRKRSVGSVGSV